MGAIKLSKRRTFNFIVNSLFKSIFLLGILVLPILYLKVNSCLLKSISLLDTLVKHKMYELIDTICGCCCCPDRVGLAIDYVLGKCGKGGNPLTIDMICNCCPESSAFDYAFWKCGKAEDALTIKDLSTSVNLWDISFKKHYPNPYRLTEYQQWVLLKCWEIEGYKTIRYSSFCQGITRTSTRKDLSIIRSEPDYI